MNHDFTKLLARPRIRRSINTIFLSQCDTAEILKIISELDSNKASNMNISVLKSCSTILVSHLVNFFDKFLDDGIFPIILKTGLITPTFRVLHAFWLKGGHFEVKDGHPDFLQIT